MNHGNATGSEEKKTGQRTSAMASLEHEHVRRSSGPPAPHSEVGELVSIARDMLRHIQDEDNEIATHTARCEMSMRGIVQRMEEALYLDYIDPALSEASREAVFDSCNKCGDELRQAAQSSSTNKNLQATLRERASLAYMHALQAVQAQRQSKDWFLIETRPQIIGKLKSLGAEYILQAAELSRQHVVASKMLYSRGDKHIIEAAIKYASFISHLDRASQKQALELFSETTNTFEERKHRNSGMQRRLANTRYDMALLSQKLGDELLSQDPPGDGFRTHFEQARHLHQRVLDSELEVRNGNETPHTVAVRANLAHIAFKLDLLPEALLLFKANAADPHLQSRTASDKTQKWIEACEARLEASATTRDSASNDRISKGPAISGQARASPNRNVKNWQNSATRNLLVPGPAQASVSDDEPHITQPRRVPTLERYGIIAPASESDVSHGKWRDGNSEAERAPTGTLNSQDDLGFEDWLSELEKVHTWLDLFKPKTRKAYKHIKIAILDSGIDGSLDVFKHSERIMAWKSYVDKDTEPIDLAKHALHRGEIISRACHDDIGHGTHLAALIMQINPLADLYVARVTVGKEDPKPQHVAKAIEFACKNWHVDIISMSLGLYLNSRNVADAVADARRNRILMFAASTNEGAKNSHQEMYPANYPEVISVSAADYRGKRLAGQATPRPGKNFTALGSEVPSAWPKRLRGPDGTESRSGSSIATAVLAASTSLLLEFLRREQVRSDQQRQQLLAAEKGMMVAEHMCKLFEEVTDLRDNFRYLAPWNLLTIDQRNCYPWSSRDWNVNQVFLTLSKAKFDFESPWEFFQD